MVHRTGFRLDSDLHTRFKHSLLDHDLSVQEWAFRMVEFYLEHPNFKQDIERMIATFDELLRLLALLPELRELRESSELQRIIRSGS